LAFNARQYIEIAFILLGGFTLVGQKMASLPSSKESEATFRWIHSYSKKKLESLLLSLSRGAVFELVFSRA